MANDNGSSRIKCLHNTTQHNTTQHNTTQHNTTQLTSEYGSSTQLDSGILFYPKHSSERTVINVDEAGRTTIMFSNSDFILIRPTQGDALFHTNGHTTSASLFSESNPNITNHNAETLSKLAHHFQFGRPVDRTCPYDTPPGRKCYDDGVGPRAADSSLDFPPAPLYSTSSTSAFCQSVYRNQGRPYDNNRTLSGCAGSSIGIAAATSVVSVAACVTSVISGSLWSIPVACGGGYALVLFTAESAVDRYNYCKSSYNETVANIEACDAEGGDSSGGGGSTYEPDFYLGDEFDLSNFGETCLVVYTRSDGGPYIPQVSCFLSP